MEVLSRDAISSSTGVMSAYFNLLLALWWLLNGLGSGVLAWAGAIQLSGLTFVGKMVGGDGLQLWHVPPEWCLEHSMQKSELKDTCLVGVGRSGVVLSDDDSSEL